MLRLCAVFVVCILHFEFCIATSASAQSLVSIGARQLVMPFENETHELRYDWLAEGGASLLTEDLTALGAKALSREDRLRAFEHLRVPATNKLSEATIIIQRERESEQFPGLNTKSGS